MKDYNNSKFEQIVTGNNFEIKSYKTLWSPIKDKYSDFSVYLRNIPLNHILLLCEQAQVMLLKNLDIEIDRYIIDSVVGNSNDQYIMFGNYNYNA